ncbi:type VII secretion-associated serine protease mycosin [Kitasatospora sp. NPDC101801]|uniref:type VII secretion-associated serine protease mycosin n=1 Tax=Kitasatospora sp. NPDC101801 TaxID=3364103 RepID=UPI00380F29C2
MTSRQIRGATVLVLGSLLWGTVSGPAAADNIRAGQWAIAKLDAEAKVWPISQGENVIVAVIDSGVAAGHQDLTGQILPGIDLSGGQSDGRVDTNGHGTAMASLIAARGHGNQEGVIGLAPKAKILPVKIAITASGETGEGEKDRLAEGIRFAVDHGAKVINMSFTGGALDDVRQAIKYAVDKDVVLVGGAGNLGNHDTPVSYPAAVPGVVAVGAVDKTGKVWDKSNKGPELTLVAPGVEIYSADFASPTGYHSGNGTSDATAYVSAIAALVRSKYPELSAGQVINRLIKSAVMPEGQKQPNDSYGYGIASAQKALAANPAVDNGPKENPLLSRPESQRQPEGSSASPQPSAPADGSTAGGNQAAAPKSQSDGGIPVFVWAIVGLLAVVVVGGVIVLARRNKGGGSGQPPYGGGGGGGAPQQQFPQYPPQQPYGAPQSPQPPYGGQQPPQQPYPPQPGGGGNPYR